RYQAMRRIPQDLVDCATEGPKTLSTSSCSASPALSAAPAACRHLCRANSLPNGIHNPCRPWTSALDEQIEQRDKIAAVTDSKKLLAGYLLHCHNNDTTCLRSQSSAAPLLNERIEQCKSDSLHAL